MLDKLFRVSRKPYQKYMWWPIRIKWKRDTAVYFFDWHAIEDHGNVFYQVYHCGSLLIKFGKRSGVFDKNGVWHKSL